MKKLPVATEIVISFIAMMIVLVSLVTVGCNNISSGVSQDDYDKIKKDLDTTLSQVEELEDEKDSLQDSYDTLQTDYQQLGDQKDSLQNDYDALVDWYDGIREEVNQRQGDLGDEKLFVTPDDGEVVAKVQQITGGFSENVNEQWADFWRMYDWVVDNIEYNSDSRLPYLPSVNGSISWYQDYWRMPSETLGDEVGDCEDMATLLASMIINYFSSTEYPCWCITWHSNESGHAAVAIPVEGDKLTILDPAGNYYTGKPGSLGSDDVSVAVDDWLSHWQPEPGIHVSGVFSDTVYETFDTSEEFVEWVLAEY